MNCWLGLGQSLFQDLQSPFKGVGPIVGPVVGQQVEGRSAQVRRIRSLLRLEAARRLSLAGIRGVCSEPGATVVQDTQNTRKDEGK